MRRQMGVIYSLSAHSGLAQLFPINEQGGSDDHSPPLYFTYPPLRLRRIA